MIYCCDDHVDMALDTVVVEQETYPTLDIIPNELRLSTTCGYCRNKAIYMVGN
ncbi:CxxH/CxxC protein [Peribacillus loiseleuriae]|uniref:CxxH/CxxC protein n=1 Tax=Peribacillus loiseleuriae TaxID=1679170 RepID=UPI003CFCD9E6